jgi:6-phosphogluconolactonase
MTVAVYVSNADSGDIHVLHLDADRGSLSPVQQMPVGGQVMPLALSPDRRRLHAARRSEPYELLSFAIDANTGELTPIGAVPLPDSMAHIACDRSGRFMFSASYGGNRIAVGRIDAEGVAEAVHQVLPTPPHAHAIQADRSNRFVFATSLGGGVVLQFRFDAARGVLLPNASPAFAPHANASPRHFAFGPDGSLVYLINELDASIDVLEIDAVTGQLRTLQTVATAPPGFAGQPWAAEIRLTPDGRFLYTSERRSSTLAAFRVDLDTGLLTLIGHTPTETQPRSIAITPDGRFVIAAGQLSHRLSVHRVDPGTGRLDKVGECAAGQNPNWIETLALIG